MQMPLAGGPHARDGAQGVGPLLYARPDRSQDAARNRPRRFSRLGPEGRSPAGQFRPCGKAWHHDQTKPDVPVEVVRVVPVADRAADVPCIVVERPASQHPVVGGPAPAQRATEGCPYVPVVCLIHPPNSRPISVTIPAAWRYWPGVSQFQRAARRR